MGVISALVSFFPSGVGGRARAQGFSPTLPCATLIQDKDDRWPEGNSLRRGELDYCH